MRKLLIMPVGIVLLSTQLNAQNRTVTGKVADEKGSPYGKTDVFLKSNGYK